VPCGRAFALSIAGNTAPKLVFRVHAVARMCERRITEEEVRRTLEGGETIEHYPDDTPYPSLLMLGWAAERPILWSPPTTGKSMRSS